MRASTVGEVIEALQQWPKDRKVKLEGCDCVGDAGYVVVEDGEVYIARQNPTGVLEIPGRQEAWEIENDYL